MGVLGSEVGFDSLGVCRTWLVILEWWTYHRGGDPVPSVASCLDDHCIYGLTLALHIVEGYTTMLCVCSNRSL